MLQCCLCFPEVIISVDWSLLLDEAIEDALCLFVF